MTILFVKVIAAINNVTVQLNSGNNKHVQNNRNWKQFQSYLFLKV